MAPVENIPVGVTPHNSAISHHTYSLGDSIQNILGDLVSCALGYVLGTVFAALDFWWLSIVWVLISEVSHKH